MMISFVQRACTAHHAIHSITLQKHQLASTYTMGVSGDNAPGDMGNKWV